MPAFVIVSSAQRDKSVDAIMCDLGARGFPDRKTDTPITVTIAENSLTIDDEPHPREIISSSGLNGVVTYLHKQLAQS